MTITKPYFRLWRPVKSYRPWGFGIGKQTSLATIDYLCDNRYACQGEKQSLVTATHLIIRDLYELFNYIEPHDDNLEVYSHRIYELFLRTATEFEANCKGILKANGYNKEEKKLNIQDYFKIASAARLPEYQVNFERWSPEHKFRPFESWSDTTSYSQLMWYQCYNEVKHNRYSEFKKANLGNLMNAIAGLLCILHAQYGEEMQSVCFEGIAVCQNIQTELKTNTFTIITPSFPEEEQYDFIWQTIADKLDPIQKYKFSL